MDEDYIETAAANEIESLRARLATAERERNEARAALACIELEILQMDGGKPADTPYWRIVSTLRRR